ncbi:MAG: RNA polymerase-binding protein DksA [Gammaproteobacteria bacterium]|nr:RNA polymerase-binding protein DksA [Gammaproteobacteria bacterium]
MSAKKPAAKAAKSHKSPATGQRPVASNKRIAKPAGKAVAPHSAAKGTVSAAKKTDSKASKTPTAAKAAVAGKSASKADKAATAATPATLKPVAANSSGKPGTSAAKASAKASTKTPVKPPEGGVVATYVRVNPRPVEAPQDNDEGEDGNLLSGPRNVQPYIVKRGEQYMSREQLDHFRNILETWKRDLMREVDRTVSHMKDEAANFPDPNDRATQEEEFSLELRTRDRERKLIRKIEEALQRIEDGSYGYCLETGEEIGVKRLEARPVATLSLEAQERRERREKQYGDRDDRYR